MKKLLLPLVLGLVGLAIGAGAGWTLRPAPASEDGATADAPAYEPPPSQLETLRMPNQFVVPVIAEGRVHSMVVLGLALEMAEGHGMTPSLARHEPRLRAIFLQVLFDHANRGGFEGVFTSGEMLIGLRRALRDAARAEFGPGIHDVLITEILRQES
jgi:flagellar protein FliL